jgi:hypothetical protein
MKYTIVRYLMIPVFAAVLTLSAPAASTAFACPMCKAATEEDDSKPRAYMYSIIFMLTVPATLVSGVTFSLFAMNRKEAEALREAGLSDAGPDGDSPEQTES